MAAGREQAGEQLAIRRHPSALAVAAEWRADRRDETNLALPVVEGVALGHLTAVIRLQRLQWPALTDPSQQLATGYHPFARPAIAGSHVHELDEAQHMATSAKTLDQRQHVVFVDATLDHTVELDALEARILRRLDAGQHISQFAATTAQGREALRIEAVEADGQSMQAGFAKRTRLPCQQAGVGGNRQILDAVDR